jgi:ribosome-binding factor A
VSDVDISPDFKNLKIFLDISNLNLSIKKEIIKKLNKEDIYIIKKVLAKKINLKFVPEPFFVLDESNAKIFKINEILKKDREKQKI